MDVEGWWVGWDFGLPVEYRPWAGVPWVSICLALLCTTQFTHVHVHVYMYLKQPLLQCPTCSSWIWSEDMSMYICSCSGSSNSKAVWRSRNVWNSFWSLGNIPWVRQSCCLGWSTCTCICHLQSKTMKCATLNGGSVQGRLAQGTCTCTCRCGKWKSWCVLVIPCVLSHTVLF